MTRGTRGTDLRLRMSTERGSMAALLEAFDARGVELLGFFGVEEAPDTDHFLVTDADAAAAAASVAGATEVGRREVLVTDPDDGVAAALRRLADRGLSIDMVYPTFDGRLVVGIEGDEVDRAIAALDE